jgi:hypothetical protein
VGRENNGVDPEEATPIWEESWSSRCAKWTLNRPVAFTWERLISSWWIRKRVDRVFQKIARGLYHHHFGDGLPALSFLIYPNFDLTSGTDLRAIVMQAHSKHSAMDLSFRALQAPEVSMWVLGFFEQPHR